MAPPNSTVSFRSDLGDAHVSLEVEAIRRDYLEKLFYQQGKFPGSATPNDRYLALAYAVRDRLIARFIRSSQLFYEQGCRSVAYLSAEYLLGPQLGNNLLCLGIQDAAHKALEGLSLQLDTLLDQEEEPGLGNGGLGRLAACYMDSLTTLNIPAVGYGLRYEYGIFDQEIRDGQQVEIADKWLRPGYPWEFPRPELTFPVGFGGFTQHRRDESGRLRVHWAPEYVVNGTPFDTPIIGFSTQNANLLRLWQATAHEEFDFQAFNNGDYYKAVVDKVRSETISKVLYPNDMASSGKRLRLQQQYLLASCSLQDMIRTCLERERDLLGFADKYAIQLNDTHPSLSVLELMRLLVDEHDLEWEIAWDITQRAIAYTNHTLLPEALETWGLPLFGSLLPRHLEIVFELNRRFLDGVRARFPDDEARLQRLSLIDERGERAVRMAHVACLGSHKINGVSELHSELLRESVLRDFAELYPERFCNVTNGITQRRFLGLINPGLSGLISEAIGDRWLRDLSDLSRLEPFADDATFRAKFRAVKRANKLRLADQVAHVLGVALNPDSLFDMQVKRIHEYKRQLMNLLRVIVLYQRIRLGYRPSTPCTVVMAGKAAPGYVLAKLIIRLANDVAGVLARDEQVRPWLRLVFIPDFNVKVAERIYPAADLSEQISLAGTEASGTGNMKMALNGALTLGTLDGANIELRARVGEDNFFAFGLSSTEVRATKQAGYKPSDVLGRDAELQAAIGAIQSGHFSSGDEQRYATLCRALLDSDKYLVLADFRAYVTAQDGVSAAFANSDDWSRRAILNVARSGFFSSDRAVREYAERIWQVQAVPVPAAVLP